MTKTIYGIDAEGFMTYEVIEIEPIGIDKEENPIYEIPKYFVDVPLPSDEHGYQLPFYRPRWTGSEWVEEKKQAEFDEEALLESLNPTHHQIVDAQLEIKILNTLMEVELI